MIALMNGGGDGGSKLLFWVLGLAIAILFAAVGVIVQDVRGDIEENRRSINILERQLLMIQGDLEQEKHLTKQLREWHLPRVSRLEDLVHQLERAGRLPAKLEEGR